MNNIIDILFRCLSAILVVPITIFFILFMLMQCVFCIFNNFAYHNFIEFNLPEKLAEQFPIQLILLAKVLYLITKPIFDMTFSIREGLKGIRF